MKCRLDSDGSRLFYVIPAQTEIQGWRAGMDTGFRGMTF